VGGILANQIKIHIYQMIDIIFSITKYIVNNNSPLMSPIKIVEAFCFQIFTRVTGSVLSKKLFNGAELILYPRCNSSSLFVYSDIPDKEEVMLLRKLADKNTVFIDVGANIGSYSLLMKDVVKDCFAFEPHPVSYRRTKMNFLNNNLNENNVINVALSNKSGQVFFSNMEDHLTENKIVNNAKGAIEVEAAKLDDWVKTMKFEKSVNFVVKIDVEGHENEMFEGGKKFFENKRVKGIVFESFDGKKLVKYLEEMGYKVNKISENNYWAKR